MQDKWEELFVDLNNELEAEDLCLEVICVGGFALNRHGVRTTHDDE